MLRRWFFSFVAVFALALSSGNAAAQSCTSFQYTGSIEAVNIMDSDGYGFSCYTFLDVVDGSLLTFDIDDDSTAGPLQYLVGSFDGSYFLTIDGPQFDGVSNFAHLLPAGDFGIGVISIGDPGSTFEYRVAVTAPIPEPSTYALMLAGLAAVGYMTRRRRVAAAPPILAT